jgi:hypothetical protein
MCMSDKSCDAWPDAIADDDVSLLWFDAKSSFLPKNCSKLLYQRTTGSSKRITMCSTNIHARTQVHLINSGGAQITYIEQHRLFNQIRQQESYCSEIGTHNRNSTLYNLSDQKRYRRVRARKQSKMSRLLLRTLCVRTTNRIGRTQPTKINSPTTPRISA